MTDSSGSWKVEVPTPMTKHPYSICYQKETRPRRRGRQQAMSLHSRPKVGRAARSDGCVLVESRNARPLQIRGYLACWKDVVEPLPVEVLDEPVRQTSFGPWVALVTSLHRCHRENLSVLPPSYNQLLFRWKSGNGQSCGPLWIIG